MRSKGLEIQPRSQAWGGLGTRLLEIQPETQTVCVDIYHLSSARATVAQLVRASDWRSEGPGSNPGWIPFSPKEKKKK